jgi:hypothetical protein
VFSRTYPWVHMYNLAISRQLDAELPNFRVAHPQGAIRKFLLQVRFIHTAEANHSSLQQTRRDSLRLWLCDEVKSGDRIES